MAKLSFRKPKLALVMGEVISLAVWLFFGDKVVDVLDTLIGEDNWLNVSGTNLTQSGCTNGTVFADAYEILGLGYDCSSHVAGADIESVSNASNGLLGIVALVMVVMILMNFISYN